MTDPRAEFEAAQKRIIELEADQERLRRSQQVQAALYRIADAASAVPDIDAFYATIHEIVSSLMSGENFYIALYDDERSMLSFPYYRDSVDTDWPEPSQWDPLGTHFGSGLTGYVLRTGQPQHVPVERWNQLIQAGEIQLVGSQGEDWLGIPLRAEGRVLGVLVVQTYRAGERYSDDDLRLLNFVGQHVATALIRFRGIDEVRQRNAELAVISEIGLALSKQLDFEAILELVGRKIRDIFDVRSISIGLLDPAARLTDWAFALEEGRRIYSDPQPIDTGLTRLVYETRGPVIVGTLAESETKGVVFLGDVKHESFLGVPIFAADKVIGVIDLESLERHAFDGGDARLLSTLAQSMGVALDNARLFDDTKRLLAETEQRNAELAVVNEIGTALVMQRDLQGVLEAVGDRAVEALGVRGLSICLIDPKTDELRFLYWIDEGVRNSSREGMVLGDPLSAQILRTKEPLLLRSAEEAAARGTPFAVGGTEAYLGVPIPAGDRAIGVFAIGSTEKNAFDEGHVRFLSTLASSMGVALENARLFDEAKRLLSETAQRNAELAVVNEISNSLVTQRDLQGVVEAVGDRAVEALGVRGLSICLLDPKTGEFRFLYWIDGGIRNSAMEGSLLSDPLSTEILRTNKPLLIQSADEAARQGMPYAVGGTESYLGVPIPSGDRAIGVFAIGSSDPRAFDEGHRRFLSTLASSLGVGIENARLVLAQKESEEQYRRLVEELPLAIYTDYPDESSTSKYVSPGIVGMFGYSIEQWLEPAFFTKVIHPDDRDAIVREVRSNLVGGDQKSSYEYRMIAADGRIVWIRDDSWIVRDEDGKPMHVQGFMLDITAQVEAAAEIRRRKQYLEALIEISPVAIVTMDRNEVVSDWNPAAARLFGYRAEEAIGRSIYDLLFLPEERDEGEAPTRLADETGRAQLIGQRRRKDGAAVDVEIVIVPLIVDGVHTGYYAIYHDITELQAARREADAANAAKSTFLASMSHEIRTPMNAIIGMSGLLVDTDLNDEQRDFAETIRTSGEALLTIINDILDFSKIEAGRLDLDIHRFDLAATIEGALDVVEPIAAGKGLELTYSIEPDLPRWFMGDAGRLRQIMLNLLSNAMKFTDAGEIGVAIGGQRVRGGGSPSWDLSLSIADSGIGIPGDQMDRLFRSFSQADASISRRYGGTGLGLAISRRLAELMGGSLVAESSGLPGEGSTFTLTLRLPESQAPESEGDGSGARAAEVVLAGRTALAVDDNATNLRILVALLERLELDVTATTSPTEARDLAAQRHYDVLLTDLQMPALDGIELAAAIRAARPDDPPRVIIVSSLGHREHEAESAGAWLAKPVKPAALREMLVRVLGERDGRSRTATTKFVADADLGLRHPLRVLLAEDNAVNQKLALRLLKGMGYEADLAIDGFKVLEALERQTYDLVLMDVQMPDMDGLEATRRIRQQMPERPVRIVAMTANAMEGDRETCLAAGMNDYLSKPIRPDLLAAALAATPALTGATEGGA
ncbi:MAG TPA: GAF domain-containing protein [Candidatus Polarisedimenticolia bacterium]|nr:GAF domain-containing protein [Candidatus Polarisedimenticolia bacterium]